MTGAARIGLITLALTLPQGAPTVEVDRDRLMRDVAVLSGPAFEGREAGSPGGRRARAWLVDQFRAIRALEPLSSAGFEHPFTFDGRSPANVVGRLTGRQPSGRVIVITAHYDHLGIRDGRLFPGADDNASGVAALLAAARHFAGARPAHTLIFGALDAEERGQRGARALLAWAAFPRDRVALNVNLDMVSRSAANELFVAGASHSPWIRDALRPLVADAGIRLRFGHDRPGVPGEEDWTHASDHGPFHDAGIPFVYFGVEDHPDYHKLSDTVARIDPRFFAAAVTTIVEAIRVFDAAIE